MPKIVVTQNFEFYGDQIARLEKLGELKIYFDTPSSSDEWLDRVKDTDVICTAKYGFKQNINNIKNKFVAVPFVGVSAVDSEKIKQNNTKVAYLPGSNKHAVSEWIIGMIFYMLRDLGNFVNTNKKIDDSKLITKGLKDKNITILGKGNIGTRVGTVCEALEMNISYFTKGKDIFESVRDADIVVDCLSSNPSTKNLLNSDFFKACKKGAFFITVTGPSICDVDVLLGALDSGQIAMAAHDSAGIGCGDVNDSFYKKLLAHPKILVTPHVSYNTDVTKRIAYDSMIDNIEAYINGNPVNLIE